MEARTYSYAPPEAWQSFGAVPPLNGYRPENHSNGNNHSNDHALSETQPIVSNGLREQLKGVQMIFVSPRGAAKSPDGRWTKNARYSSIRYFPPGAGNLAGALRPIAIEQLDRTGLLPKDTPILIPSGQHPNEGFVYNELIKRELERRGISLNRIITDHRSLDSVGEHGILLETCVNKRFSKVVQITDKTQMPRQEIIDVLFRFASGNPRDEILQEVMGHILNHPAMDLFSDGQRFEALVKYTQERQIVEGMSEVDRQGEVERLRLVHEVAQDRLAFFQSVSPEEMRLISEAFFVYHTKKHKINGNAVDWRNVVTPEVLNKIEQIGTRILLIPAEDIFKYTNQHLGRYARAVEESEAFLRTLANEFAGIAQIRMFIYNAPSDLRRQVMNGFFNRTSTSEFLEANTKRFSQALGVEV